MPVSPPSPSATFSDVLALLGSHLTELDRVLHAQLAAFEPEIRELARYCLDASGKRIRPALVFFSGWRGEEDVSSDLVRAAAVIEMVHLATLVHDDIMDDADLRRGRRTTAHAYGPAAAVLVGDALFAHALHLAAQFPSAEVCAFVSESTRRVCAGEIMQTLRRHTIDVTRDDYRRIIELKTAELFRVSCRLGSRLAGYEDDYQTAAATFGRHLGVAYQIYDDLADFFGEEKRVGKTLGTDFASGKLTLPLLVLMERLPAAERDELVAEIRGDHSPRLALRLEQMRAHGVFSVVADAIQSELLSAEAVLHSWPQNSSSQLLLQLARALRVQLGKLAPVSAL